MSDSDAYEGEMGRSPRPSDLELDRLLAGKALSGDGDDELAGFVRDLHLTFARDPSEETVTRHLAAIVEAAQLLAEGGRAAATIAHGSSTDRGRSTRLSWRRTPVKRFAAIIALVLVLAAFGGAAGAGVLPDVVQGAVSDVANHIGVSLPGVGNGDRDDGQAGDVTDTPTTPGPAIVETTPNPAATTNPAVDGQTGQKDDGAVGDTVDGQANQKDDGAVSDKDDGQAGQGDDGQAGQKHDGAVGDKDDGQAGQKHDGAVGDKDDGQAGQKHDGAVGDKDDGQAAQKDDGQSGHNDDNQMGQKDDGQSGDAAQTPVTSAPPSPTTTTEAPAMPGPTTTGPSGSGNNDGAQGDGQN